MPSPNQKEKEIDHIFFNLFELDLEYEEDSIFMIVLNDIASKHGTDATSILPHEDLRITGLNLPIHIAVEFKSLQFHLKNLKEKDCSQSIVVSTISPSMGQI